jgi:hypothetical protein
MSTTRQLVGCGQAESCHEIAVRNLDVTDYLANRCKWCGEYIFDSSTKPRRFCDNGNVCWNNYSRRGVNRTVWEALKRAKSTLVAHDVPSFAPTMVRQVIGTKKGEVEVIRVKPMRLFPSAKKQHRGVGMCPKGKELGVNTPVPEPTPLELTRPQVTRKVGNAARVKTNFCDACGDYVHKNHEHPASV